LYLVYSSRECDDNSCGRNAVIVDSATPSAALAAAGAVAVGCGEFKLPNWQVVELATIVPVVIEGHACPPRTLRGA